jgi:hypothetical protein
MANAYGSATVPNSLSGMGTAPTLTYSYTFYNSLPAATAGLTGTAAAGDTDSKYVKVTVNAVTVPTIFPVSFVKSGGTNNFAAGASAIAGFTAITVCAVTPIFICNPYEPAGNTDDATATQDLQDAFADPATLRKMIRMDRSNTSPGHFGWLQTADGCNNTNCMRDNIASVNGACYNSNTVALATGNKNSVEQYFDTRFDIYSKPLPTGGISSTNAPAVNVRKGYLPSLPKGNQGVDWCSANPGNGPTSALGSPNTGMSYDTVPPPSVTVTGTTTKNSTTISNVSSTSGYGIGYTITGPNISSGTMITGIPSSTSLSISPNFTESESRGVSSCRIGFYGDSHQLGGLR